MCYFQSDTFFFDREHYLSKHKGIITRSNNSPFKLYQFVGNESLADFNCQNCANCMK